MLLLLYVSSNFILPRMSMNEGHVNCTFGGVAVKNFSVGRLDVQNFKNGGFFSPLKSILVLLS